MTSKMKKLIEYFYPEYEYYRRSTAELQCKDELIWESGWTWDEVIDHVSSNPKKGNLEELKILAERAKKMVRWLWKETP